MCSCIGSFLLDVATTCWLVANSFNLPIFYSTFAIRLPLGRMNMHPALALPAASQPPPDPSMLTQYDLTYVYFVPVHRFTPNHIPLKYRFLDCYCVWFKLRQLTITRLTWEVQHSKWWESQSILLTYTCRNPSPLILKTYFKVELKWVDHLLNS